MKNLVKEWIYPILAALIITFMVNKFLIFKIYVPSGSMLPTIMIGDQIFVTKSYNKDNIKRGDVVVFFSEERGQLLVKRAIGLPGEKVDIKNDGTVYINGTVLKEPYVINKDNKTGSFNVPEDSYLFLGDNRVTSIDSRYWNNPYISKEAIKGKARLTVYPFNRFGWMK
jgi:signal peptidase I